MPSFIKHLFFLSTLLFMLSACNNMTEESLRLAHINWPGYEALSLAKSRNLYQNINIKIYRPANNSLAARAFTNNIVDVVALTLTEAIEAQSKSSEPLMIIAALDISNGGDVIIAKKNIKSLKELEGKRIGIEPTAFGAFFISRAAASSPQLELNKIHLVPINIEEHHKMFLENKVDAIATYEPEKSKILHQKGHVLFDSTKIPNEIIDVLVTRTSYAEKNPQALTQLLNGYFKALQQIKNNPDSAIETMAKYENIHSNEFKKSLDGIHIPDRKENLELLAGASPKLKATAIKIRQFMQRKKIITSENNILPEISDRFLLIKKD